MLECFIFLWVAFFVWIVCGNEGGGDDFRNLVMEAIPTGFRVQGFGLAGITTKCKVHISSTLIS